MHPASLQDAFIGVLLNAVVAPIVPTVPISPAVAPGQVDVDFALVGRVHPFEQRGVCRKHCSIPAHPAFQGDGRVNAEQGHGIDFHAVVAVHAHELRCTCRRGIAHLGQSVWNEERLHIQATALCHVHAVQRQVHHQIHVCLTREGLSKVHVPRPRHITHGKGAVGQGGPSCGDDAAEGSRGRPADPQRGTVHRGRPQVACAGKRHAPCRVAHSPAQGIEFCRRPKPLMAGLVFQGGVGQIIHRHPRQL